MIGLFALLGTGVALGGLVFWLRSSAKQEGRDEVLKEVQRDELEKQQKAGEVLAEHRTPDDAADRLQRGDF